MILRINAKIFIIYLYFTDAFIQCKVVYSEASFDRGIKHIKQDKQIFVRKRESLTVLA